MLIKPPNNTTVFQDTEQRYTTDPILTQAVELSCQNQKFISEADTVTVPAPIRTQNACVTVTGKRTIQAAEPYARIGKKVCVLNFANSVSPGGGVRRGANAQEEAICRVSTLYPCLDHPDMMEAFYLPHKKEYNARANNDCIYTPDVCVFKTDTVLPELIPTEEWWYVNVITCAAPNLWEVPLVSPENAHKYTWDKITHEELDTLLRARIRRIFEIAAGNENDVLILGAFGCGVFKNPPEMVAGIFNDIMRDYLRHFDAVEYAVYHSEKNPTNYEAFLKQISRS